jgi:hypothetical protein
MIEHGSERGSAVDSNADDSDRGGTGIGTSQPQSTGRRWIVSVFGDITRTGSWPPRRTTSPIALFGDIDLDFRQATLPSGDVVVVTAVAPFGNVDVVVPARSHADVGGFTLFGSKKVAVAPVSPDQNAPSIRVRGFSIFGSVKVSSP